MSGGSALRPRWAPTAELSLTQDPLGNSHKNLLILNQLLNWNQTLIKQSLDGPRPKLCLVVPPSDQDGCTAELSLTQDPMGNSHKNHLIWNQQLNQNQTLMEQSLDGPLPKLCPAVALSHQDGRHSAVALLLKAALMHVSDYRLLGVWFIFSNSDHVGWRSGLLDTILEGDHPRTIPPSLVSSGQVVSEENIFQ